MRVLLVDDDEDDRIIFQDAVRQVSFDTICYTLSDGIEALRFLYSIDHLPDILFLDINMPRIDGKQTFDAIRMNPKLARIPVVMYSTSNSETDIQWSRGRNAKYLVKPNDFPTLVNSLKQIFNELKTDKTKRTLIRQVW